MLISMDASDLVREAADLASVDVIADVRQVVSKGALQIKNQLQEEARASEHFKFAGLINYEQSHGATFAEAEIGPQKRGAGNLANLAYFGGSNGGGGTLPDPTGAMEAEAPNFENALADVIAAAFD